MRLYRTDSKAKEEGHVRITIKLSAYFVECSHIYLLVNENVIVKFVDLTRLGNTLPIVSEITRTKAYIFRIKSGMSKTYI